MPDGRQVLRLWRDVHFQALAQHIDSHGGLGKYASSRSAELRLYLPTDECLRHYIRPTPQIEFVVIADFEDDEDSNQGNVSNESQDDVQMTDAGADALTAAVSSPNGVDSTGTDDGDADTAAPATADEMRSQWGAANARLPFPLQPGTVVLDEAHLLKNPDCLVWQSIRAILERSPLPVHLLALSATPVVDGPKDLQPFVHALAGAARCWHMLDGRDKDMAARGQGWINTLNDWVLATASVQRHATRAPPASPSGSHTQCEERWAELSRAQAITAKHRKALFSALALRREADDRFLGRGTTLVDTKPVVISTRDVRLTEEARRFLQLPYRRTATAVRVQYTHYVQSWRGISPARRPARMSLVDFVAQQSPVQNQSTFYYSSLASLLPGTVPLFAPVPDPTIDLSSTGAQDAIRASAADIEASPYWPHLDQLVQHSPKLDALRHLLAERIDRRGEYNGRDGGSVSLPLAAVVFCTRPVTTHIVHLALHRAFGDRAKVAGLYASRPPSQREATLALFRGPVALSKESEAAECAVGPRILVTTMALVSTGIDLTRASLVIILEPGVNLSQETQVAGRVQRQGQLASDVRLYKLTCTDDVMEKIVLLRQAVKASSVVDSDSDELRQAVATWLDLDPDDA
ncbi:hypothetical protein Sste5346_008935 [Sporothrix stenoceras]|uniref:Uncharacterized protein n=1 Tax=Sporothrix stenoceras TaxID=5173 RepID=A0ABR3YMF5_9PEZI